jgi:hypothetical protein
MQTHKSMLQKLFEHNKIDKETLGNSLAKIESNFQN